MPQRRFPPPWTVEDLGSCFVVKDSAGEQIAEIKSPSLVGPLAAPSCQAA
jgi:hypothetical protein